MKSFGDILCELGVRDELLSCAQRRAIDEQDWGPRLPPYSFHVVTALWLLDDFTRENGGTRLVPGTHRWTRPIDKSLANPASRHPQQIQVQAPAGSVLVFNGHLWHSGMRNKSEGPRRTLQCSYVADEHRHIGQTDPNHFDGVSPAVLRLLTGET